MKQVLGAYLISGGGLADLRGGLAPAGPPVATGLVCMCVSVRVSE